MEESILIALQAKKNKAGFVLGMIEEPLVATLEANNKPVCDSML